ncbi:MAG TPA: preprotein translocase subunit SecE [Myxococcaceae bacterium]|nr:preprotein translocase subunit SecE [Myxococcaceae bacterium]
MSPGRLVVLFYLGAGIVLALFLGKVLGLVFAEVGVGDKSDALESIGLTPTQVLGVVLAGGIGVFCFVNAKTRTISNEVATELMKVTWPTWEETRTSTTAVVVASLVAAVILFGIDTVAYKLMVDWLPALWGKL